LVSETTNGFAAAALDPASLFVCIIGWYESALFADDVTIVAAKVGL
jgi:hypothetical protein